MHINFNNTKSDFKFLITIKIKCSINKVNCK